MKHRSLSHIADHVLLRQLTEVLANERGATAEALLVLAEVQRRRLYRGFGYRSLRDYCVGHLHLSASAAYKRTRAAGAARQFPVLFEALADGRLHLSAIVALEPYLRPGNADELVTAATHRTREQVELLLAERFPRPDVPTVLAPLESKLPEVRVSPGTLSLTVPEPQPAGQESPPAPSLATSAPRSAAPTPFTRVTPLAPRHFAFQATLDEETVELLRRAQALLGQALPAGDPVQVLKRVLQDWVQAEERRRYALTEKPRARRSRGEGRYVPAEVKRAVLERDQGRCTFVADSGHRCEARDWLEFDHVTPVARGGRTALANLRLRCRAHNQLEAERVFGAGFMERKRGEARRVTPAARAPA